MTPQPGRAHLENDFLSIDGWTEGSFEAKGLPMRFALEGATLKLPLGGLQLAPLTKLSDESQSPGVLERAGEGL